MPDFDIFEHKAAPGWNKVYSIISSEGSHEEVADAMRFALARSLRNANGLPGFESLTRVLDQCVSGDIPILNAFDKLRSIEMDFGGHRHTRVAVRAIEREIEDIANGFSCHRDCQLLVAQRFLNALVIHHSFARFSPEFIGSRFSDPEEAYLYERAVLTVLEPSIKKLANQLIKNPDGKGIRAPKSPINIKHSTLELLDIPI